MATPPPPERKDTVDKPPEEPPAGVVADAPPQRPATDLIADKRKANTLLRNAVGLVQKGDDAGAIRLLEEAVQLDGSSTLARNNLATLYLRRQRFEVAAEQLREVLRLEPDQLEAMSLLGYALAMRDEFEEAERYFRAALERNPEHAETLDRCSVLLLRTGRPEDAVDLLERLVAVDPGSADHHFDLAVALFCANRIDEAVNQCLQAQDYQPRDGRPMPGMMNRLIVLLKERESDRPQDKVPKAVSPADFLAVATELARAELTREAASAVSYAVSQDSTLVGAHRLLAQLARASERDAKAVEALERGLEANPGDRRLSQDLAWLLATSTDPPVRNGERARQIAERLCTESRRQDPWELAVLAAAFAELGDFGGASSAILEAKSLRPPPSLDRELDRYLEHFMLKRPLHIAGKSGKSN